MTTNVVNAYPQAPWRLQVQWVGTALLGLVIVVLIAGFYLQITANATAAGAQIKELQNERQLLHIDIAALRTQLGELTAADVMSERAVALGYQPADLTNATYLTVPGYGGREITSLAPAPAAAEPPALILPSYRQSLWEVLLESAMPFLVTPPPTVP